MPIYATSSNRCNTNRNAAINQWLKIARVAPGLGSNDDTVSTTFLVNISGEERTAAYATGLTMLVSLKYTTGQGQSNVYYDTDGTYLKVETIVAHEIDGFVPGDDLKLLVNNNDYDYSAELWMRVKPAASDVFVEKLSGSKSGNDGSADSFDPINGTQNGVTNNYAASLPATIKNGSDTDRSYAQISGEYSDKLIKNLEITGNLDVVSDIRHAGDTDTKIAFDTDQISLRAGNSELVTITNTEVVINDNSADKDFRIKSDSGRTTFIAEGGSGYVGIGTSVPKKDLVIVPEVSTNDAVVRIGANVASDGDHMSGRVEIAEDADVNGEMTHGGYLEFDGDAAVSAGSGQLILGVRDGNTTDVDVIVIDRDAPANSITITDSSVTIPNLVGAGSADTALRLTNARNIALSGDVTGTVSFDGSANVTMTTAVANNSHTHTSANISDATSANTANMIVKRNGSGGFSAGTITATLSGTATNAANVYVNNDEDDDATRYLTFVDNSTQSYKRLS